MGYYRAYRRNRLRERCSRAGIKQQLWNRCWDLLKELPVWQFVQAQKLREWLIEIDSTAVGQILRASEIIEQEKVAAIDKGHLEIWSELYDILTTDEFSAVYYALKHKEFSK